MTVSGASRSRHATDRARHVRRVFETPGGLITAVDDVSLAIGAGEILCLVGESGCGKTTTGTDAGRTARPTSGRLLFEGRDVWQTKGEEFGALPPRGPDRPPGPLRLAEPDPDRYQTLSAAAQAQLARRGATRRAA